jgi:UDP-glucuronate 4-epimerase
VCGGKIAGSLTYFVSDEHDRADGKTDGRIGGGAARRNRMSDPTRPGAPQPAPDPARWAEALRGGPAVLVTGAAGFIGHHLCRRLLAEGIAVTGLDNLNAYYDVALKRARLAELARLPGFAFIEADIADRGALAPLFAPGAPGGVPRHVVHLAAQAGVRHSIDNPFAYADSNLTGFLTVLEACRHAGVAHLVYASSSSVYGGNTRLPFTTADPVDHPVSLYAATKKANELMAHCYSHLYGLPATGLRFFTVYGPWGRPDMAYWKFTEAIWEGRPIDVYNHGRMARDFTYIDDIVEAMARLIPLAAAPDPGFDRAAPTPATSWAPHRVYNIGATRPEPLTDLIGLIERAVGRPAEKRFLPMQPGDVVETWADVADLEAVTGFRPAVPLAEGIDRFVGWYRRWRGNA